MIEVTLRGLRSQDPPGHYDVEDLRFESWGLSFRREKDSWQVPWWRVVSVRQTLGSPVSSSGSVGEKES